MIKIKLKKDNNYVKEIIIKGHALYDDFGKDIVCAAVSATYLCTVNGIIAIDGNSISVTSNDDRQEINVCTKDSIILTLLQNMIDCFLDLEKQYPKNIKLDKEEE